MFTPQSFPATRASLARAVRPAARRLLLGATLLTAAMLHARHAQAYCRQVITAVPSGWDPADAGCYYGNPDGGTSLPQVFWPNRCVGYSLQVNGSRKLGISLGQAESVAYDAFAAWSNVECPGGGSPSITASELPAVSCNRVPPEGHNNVIMFDDEFWPYTDSANAIGVTTLRLCTSSPCLGDPSLLPGTIIGADTEINSAEYDIVASLTLPDGGRAPSGVYDLPTILTHEAGHFLGLAHSADRNAVMYAFYHPGSTVPQPDDIAGICEIYPPNGSRTTASGSVAGKSCDTEPMLGFEDQCGSIDASAAGGANDGGDHGDPPAPCTDTLLGCSVGVGPGAPARAHLWALLAVPLAFLVRSRRTRRGALWTAGAMGAAVVSATAAAAASVSVVAGFDDLLRRATAVAVATPLEQRAVWEDGRIATYTRVQIDVRIAGSVDSTTWIRTLGGELDGLAELVEGQALFRVGSPSLVFLRPHVGRGGGAMAAFGVLEGAQGQFPIERRPGQPARLTLSSNLGALLPSARAGDGRPVGSVLGGLTVERAAHIVAEAWPRFH